MPPVLKITRAVVKKTRAALLTLPRHRHGRGKKCRALTPSAERMPRVFDNEPLREGRPSETPGSPAVAVVVLNWKQPVCFGAVWARSQFRVVADGGADRVFHDVAASYVARSQREGVFADLATVRKRLMPDLVCGDLDSISTEAGEFYKREGVEVRDLSIDQDTTDLMKCLSAVSEWVQGRGRAVRTVVLGAFGGRFDHVMGNLWALHRFVGEDILLVGDGNVARLLPPGESRVRVLRDTEGPECGIVPLLGRARVSSQGLRWDMDALELSFDGIISTSNLADADEVHITTDVPVLFTLRCALADLLE